MDKRAGQKRGQKRRKKMTITPLERRVMLDASLPAIAGQVLWLDAADSATILDADGDNASTGTGGANDGFSGSVTTWVDKSTSGYDVTAASAALQPVYTLNGLNARNVVTFDGVDDRLTNLAATVAGNSHTTFIVFNKTSSGIRQAVFEMSGGSSRNGWFIENGGSGTINYYLNGSFFNYGVPFSAGAYEMLSTTQNGTALSLYQDAVHKLSSSGTNRVTTTGLFVGDDSTTGDWLQGNIAEIIVYDRTLSSDERHDVETYLAGKWGLSISNSPTVLSHNTGETLLEGGSVTLTNAALAYTDADNSDGNLVYTITNAIDFGTLTNTNTSLVLGLNDTFTQSDIDNGYITYTHDGTDNYSDTFSFNVSDQYANQSGSFTFTMTPVDDAPHFDAATIISSEDFEGGATGWSDNTTTNGGAFYTTFLGRHSMEGGMQDTFKTYTLSGTQNYVTISFDMYELDSWDNEFFSIFVDDVQVFSSQFRTNQYNVPTDGSAGAVSWTIQETTPFDTNIAFGSWNDQRYHFNLIVNSTSSTIKLGFSSTLNQAITDEAWGVDNIIVSEIGGGGAPGPFYVSEISSNGDIFGQATATDTDIGAVLTYSITGGTGVGVFAIDPSTGELSVLDASLIDFETTPSYTLDLLVTDNTGLTDTTTVTVNVIDAPENTAPVITPVGPLSVSEDAALNTVVGTVNAIDAEGDTISYAITSGNTDGIFSINSSTGQIRVSSLTNLNYEYGSSYTLTIRATDNGFGNLSSTRNVVINIIDVNEAPTFDEAQTILNNNFGIMYNATTGNFYQYISSSVNYATALSNAASMTLNGVSGHLATSTSAAENSFLVGLIGSRAWLGASDAAIEGTWNWEVGPEAGQTFWLGTSTGSAQNGFYTNWGSGEPNNSGNEDAMELLNTGRWNDRSTGTANPYIVEWEGVDVISSIANGPYNIAENSSNGTSVGFVHAGDPDAGDTLTFAVTGGTGQSIFALDSTTGEITLTNTAAVNYEVTTSYTLDLLVTDSGGLTDTRTVTINIVDANDTPTDIALAGNQVDENSVIGTVVGTLSSTDEDPADTHTYSFVNNPGNKFTIVGNEIRVAADIDYEATQHITLRIRTDDGNGGTYDKNITIDIGDEMDTYTRPPESGVSTTDPVKAGEADFALADKQSPLIQETIRHGEFGQQSAFYGMGKVLQIIRDHTTASIKSWIEKVQSEDNKADHQNAPLKTVGKIDDGTATEQAIRSHYTNIREVLEKKERFAKENPLSTMPSRTSGDETTKPEGDDRHMEMNISELDERFVDVMTYHEQKQQKLRRVLLS